MVAYKGVLSHFVVLNHMCACDLAKTDEIAVVVVWQCPFFFFFFFQIFHAVRKLRQDY